MPKPVVRNKAAKPNELLQGRAVTSEKKKMVRKEGVAGEVQVGVWSFRMFLNLRYF